MYPRLLQLGDFKLPTYGVLFFVGVMLGLWVSVHNSERQGIDPEKARKLGVLVILAGVFGAKVLTVINDWSFYSTHPREIFSLGTLQAGGVFLGGLLAALFAAAWYIGKNQLPLLATWDAFAPGIALSHAIGRIGCFAAGCCWGKPTHAIWGVTFTNPLTHQLAETPLDIPLVPTQLLESAVEFANFVFLMWLLGRKKFDGQVIAAYFCLYGSARYLIEYFRGDPGRGSVLGGSISGTQLIAILLVVAGGSILFMGSRRRAALVIAH